MEEIVSPLQIEEENQPIKKSYFTPGLGRIISSTEKKNSKTTTSDDEKSIIIPFVEENR